MNPIRAAHAALKPKTEERLMRVRTPKVVAWQVDDSEGYRFVYHATSRNKATALHRRAMGWTFREMLDSGIRATRCYAMDNLPIDNWHVLATGVVSHIEHGCPGCGAALYTDCEGTAESLNGGRCVIYADNWVQGDGPVLHDEATGEVWCSRECYDRYRGRA